MEPLNDLVKGMEVLIPFLKEYDFKFADFNYGSDSTGEFALSSFKNKQKIFIIDYRFRIGQVLYQFDNSIISHHFYIDQLGFADKKKHNEFLSDDKPEAFEHILYDFQFLVDDFFKGECFKLQRFAKLKDNIIYELDQEVRNKNIAKTDILRIEKARDKFRNKEFQTSLNIYEKIENIDFLSELDMRIIEFCKRHL